MAAAEFYSQRDVALGMALAEHRETQAIAQYPDDWFAWAGLGECFAKLNNLPQAEQALHHASDLAHEPRVTEAWRQVRAMMESTNSPARK